MADDPTKPPDDGQIGLPTLDAGMNKRAPKNLSPSGKAERLGLTDKSKKKDDAELLAKARKRFERAMEESADNRKLQLAALKFKAGEQWSPEDAQQRNIDRRPCLTINRLPTFIRQVTNDQRMNRPAINISPVGDKGDPEAAKMYRGMIRAIERASAADIAYDTAFESAVSIGVGYWRLNTEWDEEDTFHQTIVIERIRNPFTVYGDPNSKWPDGSDWKHAFVADMIPEDEFKAQWPKAQIVPFELGGTGEKLNNWKDKNNIRVAEYWEVCEEPRTLVQLQNGHVGWKDELSPKHSPITDERESHDRKVCWWKITAVEVLERGEWLGKRIPIIPVFGNEIDIEGRLKLTGLIEPAMDSQRMYNYYKTKEAEAVALAPMAPFIMEEGQAEGHEDEWRNANRTANPVLFYKGTTVGGRPAPPPQRQPMAGIPEGFVNGAQSAAQDIQATTGIRFDVNADHRSVDERSGKALREFNRPQDLGASHYMDNLARSLRRTGDDLLYLIPKVYDEKQIVTILREDDKEEQVQIDPHAPEAYSEKNGPKGKVKTFNPTEGKYGVTVTIGPSFATKRVEASESMIELIKVAPHIGQMASDLIVKNMDFEGAEELSARLAKALPPNLLTPDQKDVPPQVQALIQHMQQMLQQAAQEKQQLLAALNDKGADRQIAQDKIDKDFEAKVLGIIQKGEAESERIMIDKIKVALEQLRSEEAGRREDVAAEREASQPAGKPGAKKETKSARPSRK